MPDMTELRSGVSPRRPTRLGETRLRGASDDFGRSSAGDFLGLKLGHGMWYKYVHVWASLVFGNSIGARRAIPAAHSPTADRPDSYEPIREPAATLRRRGQAHFARQGIEADPEGTAPVAK